MVILTGCQQAGEQEAAVPSEPQVITFADSMIEQETRKILNKPVGEITEDEVLTITEFGQWERDGVLELFEGEVTTLSDLKWFKNLKRLHLPSSSVQSLEGIGDLIALTKLEWLSIGDSLVTDLSMIKNLTELTHLFVPDCGISDLPLFRFDLAAHYDRQRNAYLNRRTSPGMKSAMPTVPAGFLPESWAALSRRTTIRPLPS